MEMRSLLVDTNVLISFIEKGYKGKPIPINDMWIAAAALERGVELCSFDEHFSNIAMLQFVKLDQV